MWSFLDPPPHLHLNYKPNQWSCTLTPFVTFRKPHLRFKNRPSQLSVRCEKRQKTIVNRRDEKKKISQAPLPLTHWTLGYIYDNCIPLQKWQNKSARGAAYDRNRMARSSWFKWQVIEQQTHIKTVLMSSVFHLGSIRWLVEADANTRRRERLQRWESIELPHYRTKEVLWSVVEHTGPGAAQWYAISCGFWCVLLFLVILSYISWWLWITAAAAKQHQWIKKKNCPCPAEEHTLQSPELFSSTYWFQRGTEEQLQYIFLWNAAPVFLRFVFIGSHTS